MRWNLNFFRFFNDLEEEVFCGLLELLFLMCVDFDDVDDVLVKGK